MAEELLALAERVAAGARDGEQVEAYVTRVRSTEIRVFAGDVESLAVSETEGVGVRVIVAGRQGYAWAGSLDPDVVDETLAEARDNAAFGEPDEWQALVAATDPGVGAAASAGADGWGALWHEDLLAVPVGDKVDLAIALERATAAADSRLRGVEESTYGDSAVESAVASSRGISAAARRTLCSCAVSALAGEGTATQTGYGFSAGRTFADLDLDIAAADAARRATRMLGARPIASTRLPVIFDPLVTRSLIGLIGSAVNGEAILKGRSMFVGRAGEQVAHPSVTLVDDPTILASLGASPHDAEGVPTRRVELVRSGVLTGFLHNSYTGRRSGEGTTGSAMRGGFKSAPGVGSRAMHIVPGTSSPEALLASVPQALYVQSVSGLHSGTNPVSGDFSVGAEGLMVRGGELAEPVREVTVASTMPRMLLDVAGIGSDLTWLPGGAAGLTLLVAEMTVSGG